jgi:hypothetical protein
MLRRYDYSGNYNGTITAAIIRGLSHSLTKCIAGHILVVLRQREMGITCLERIAENYK